MALDFFCIVYWIEIPCSKHSNWNALNLAITIESFLHFIFVQATYNDFIFFQWNMIIIIIIIHYIKRNKVIFNYDFSLFFSFWSCCPFFLSLNSTKFTMTKKLTAKLVQNIYEHKYICIHEPSVNINVLLRQQFSVFDYMALNVLMLLFDFLSLACSSVNAIKRVESIMRTKKKLFTLTITLLLPFDFICSSLWNVSARTNSHQQCTAAMKAIRNKWNFFYERNHNLNCM